MDVEDLCHLDRHAVDSLVLYLEIAGNMNLSGCFCHIKKKLKLPFLEAVHRP